MKKNPRILTVRPSRAAYQRARYARDPDKARAKTRARRARDPDKARAKARAQARARYARDPEKYAAQNHSHRARRRGAPGHATAAQIQARRDYYGGLCWIRYERICRKVEEAMDHVKPLAAGGSHWPANLRPACSPCNNRKHDKWSFPCNAYESAQSRMMTRSLGAQDRIWKSFADAI